MGEYVAGIDLGATHTRAAVASGDGTVLAVSRQDTPARSQQAVVDTLRNVLETTLSEVGVSAERIAKVGVGSMGPLDDDRRAVVRPPNLPGVDRIPLVEAIRGVVDASVTVRNDATAGAIGVHFYSEGAPENLVYVTISSGLGAGAIVDGSPLVGATGNAAEAGHFQLDPASGVECGCGNTGHWEGFCSGENLPQYARYLARTEDRQTELTLPEVDARELFEAAPEDPLARTVIDRFGRWNTRGVAELVHAYDPELVVFGGAVALNNPEAVVEPIRDGLSALTIREPPGVRMTALGDQAVLRGGVATALST